MGEFFGECVGQKGEALVFGLELVGFDHRAEVAFVGVDIAMGADLAVGEERTVDPAVGQRGGGTEREGEFAGESGIADALGGDVAVKFRNDDLEGGVGGLGGIDERDPAIAVKCGANLRAEDGLTLGDEDLGGDRLDVEGGERELAAGAQLIVRAAGEDQAGRGKEQEAPEHREWHEWRVRS